MYKILEYKDKDSIHEALKEIPVIKHDDGHSVEAYKEKYCGLSSNFYYTGKMISVAYPLFLNARKEIERDIYDLTEKSFYHAWVNLTFDNLGAVTIASGTGNTMIEAIHDLFIKLYYNYRLFKDGNCETDYLRDE